METVIVYHRDHLCAVPWEEVTIPLLSRSRDTCPAWEPLQTAQRYTFLSVFLRLGVLKSLSYFDTTTALATLSE